MLNTEDNLVHLVWIGNKFSLLEQLSIKLLQKQNLVPHLWSYNEIENVPDGVVLCDASEIMPEESIFTFQGIREGLPNEGKGSVSHWSDRFQLKLLQKYGGWYSQLDVACLKLPEDREYYFAGSDSVGIVTYIMKAPKGAPFLRDCIDELTEKINGSTPFDWSDSMQIIGNHVCESLPDFISTDNYECGVEKYMDGDEIPGDNIEFIHWCNALCGEKKNDPKNSNSLYYKLLKQEGLI